MEASSTWIKHSLFTSLRPALNLTFFHFFLTGLSWQNDSFCFIYYLNKKKTANNLIEENALLLGAILCRMERDSCFGKDWPSLTLFRHKKLLKSEFIQKMIIKDAAFSSIYHEQNFNYLCQVLALQHWENCQCLPSSDVRTPTIKHRTAPNVFLAGVCEILSKISECLRRHCIATLSMK